MNYKDEYKKLLQIVKTTEQQKGHASRNEDISEALGYNRSYFSTLLGEKGKVTEGHIKTLKAFYPYLSENITKPSGQPKKGSDVHASNNQSLTMQALVNLTESNRSLAESNKTLADSHRELVQLVKGKVTVNADPHINVDLEARFSDILMLIADVGTGKKWKTKEEAIKELNKHVLFPG